MAREWHETTLGDLIDIKHGFAFEGKFIHEEPHGDVLLTPGNFALGGGFKGDKLKYYDGPVLEEFVLRKGDLLVTMTDLSKQSDTLGYPALIPSSPEGKRYLHNQRLGKIFLREPTEIDATYIYYVMCGAEYRHEVLASATGTTVKHTSPDRIKQFRILLPPLPEQRAIAQILGSLDDKIDLNRRMNETLEAMARALFKSWFVDFDPVRAKMEGRDPGLSQGIGDLFPGQLDNAGKPEGWAHGTLFEVADSPKRGISPADVAEDTPYIGLEHMPQRSIALMKWEGAGKVTSNKSQFKRGEFLFGKLRTYFHKVGCAPVDGICSTDIVVVIPKAPDWAAYTLCCLSSNEFVDYTDQTSTGTKMPRTSWKTMEQYKICLPSKQVLCVFQSIAQPLIERIIANIHENRTCAQTRDLLLPKLISGNIRIREVERVVEEVA